MNFKFGYDLMLSITLYNMKSHYQLLCKKNCGSVGESNCSHQQSKLASQPLRYPCTLVPLCFPYNSSQSLRLDYLIIFSNSYGSQIWTEAYVDHNNCYVKICIFILCLNEKNKIYEEDLKNHNWLKKMQLHERTWF
jgi:hypothetical protein